MLISPLFDSARALLDPKPIIDPDERPQRNGLLPALGESDCSLEKVQPHLAVPTISDYMELKLKYEALQRNLMEQEAPDQPDKHDVAAERQQLSLLSYCEFTSDLTSIAEEHDKVPAPRCQLFTSSPDSCRGPNHSSMHIRNVSPVPASASPIVETNAVVPTVACRRSMRLLSRQMCIEEIKTFPDQRKLRRSTRISNQTQVKSILKSELTSKVLGKSETGVALERFSATCSKGSQDTRLRKHRSTLLSMLNSATVKDLQALPHIGPKTALALVMQR